MHPAMVTKEREDASEEEPLVGRADSVGAGAVPAQEGHGFEVLLIWSCGLVAAESCQACEGRPPCKAIL